MTDATGYVFGAATASYRRNDKAGTRPASSLKHTIPRAPAYRMHAAASFPTVITACSISGDHGLL